MMALQFVVTAIREHPRRRGRFVIEIDAKDVAVVGMETIAELALSVGAQMAPAAMRALAIADRRIALLDRALNLLSVHARSQKDLKQRLRRTEAAPDDIDWALARLVALGYLDDAAYARQLARARISSGASKRRIHDELYRKGVGREIATEAVDAVLSEVDTDEYGAAVAAARKRASSLSRIDAATRRRRLYAFLVRRGYEFDVVRRVVNDVLNEGNDDPVES